MKDLEGKTFGLWTALKFSHKTPYGALLWLCRCTCGREKLVREDYMKNGRSTSCGCSRKIENLFDQKFGRLLVLSFSHQNKRKYYWNCKCDCGNEVIVRADKLKSGLTFSCGCYHKERVSKQCFKHGKIKTKVYVAWVGMIQRCTNENSKAFERYGGRGITVCNEWLESFETFYEDMGDPPSKKYQLDRINNEEGYGPNNCRWVTCSENNRNKRTNRVLSYDGKTQCIASWSEEIGLTQKCISTRLASGWSEEEALAIPSGQRRKKYHANI